MANPVDIKPPSLDTELTEMTVGERIGMDEMEILRVPNGWIFYRTHKAGICGTFVPSLRPPKTEKKPGSSIYLQ
jgi:hypothetical protein